MPRSRKAVVIRSEPVELGTPEDIQKAWRMLAGGASHAAQTLVDISRFGRSEVARVQASMTILDRVNLGTRSDIVVRAVPAEFDQAASPDDSVSPTELLKRRLAQLAAAELEPAESDTEFGDVIDAEIVSPWTEQEPVASSTWQEPVEQVRPTLYGETVEPDGPA
jgi:hypothetical protein